MNNVIALLDWKVQRLTKIKANLKRHGLTEKGLDRLQKDLNKPYSTICGKLLIGDRRKRG